MPAKVVVNKSVKIDPQPLPSSSDEQEEEESLDEGIVESNEE